MRKSLKLNLCCARKDFSRIGFKQLLENFTPGQEITLNVVERIINYPVYVDAKTELFLQCIKKFNSIKEFKASFMIPEQYVIHMFEELKAKEEAVNE